MPPITEEFLEWARPPEAAEQGWDEARIKHFEELWRKQELFVAKVKTAFSDVVLGNGVGLLEANAIEDCRDPKKWQEARGKDERDSWEAIPEDALFYGRWALCFTDAEGFRFLIPALMLGDLTGDLDGSVVIHLCNTRDDRFDRLSKLSPVQLEAIIEFLQLFLDDPDAEFHHDAIKESLAEFWKPLLQQRIQEEQSSAPEA